MRLVTAGPEVIRANGFLARSHFVSETRQLFETEEGSFVYKMDEGTIHKVPEHTCTLLLLKLLRLQEYHE